MCPSRPATNDGDVSLREIADDDLPVVRHLFAEYAASLPFALDFQSFDAELAALPGAYARPRGAIVLVERHGAAIGVGALRPHGSHGCAEIKRMYLRPSARGEGIGRRLLEALLLEARRRGYARARLDSHAPTMGTAIALYRSVGFREVPPDGSDLDGALVFFETSL